MICRSTPLLFVISTLIACIAVPARAAEPATAPVPLSAGPVTPEQVKAAIEHAKDYLWSQQKKDGTWELVPQRTPEKPGWEWEQDMSGGQWGGMTALAILALVSAGENPQGERLAPAIEFLRKADIIGTYALCMRCQVFGLLPDKPENKAVIRKDVAKLLGMMRKNGPARGFYGYVGTGENWSLMASQYGVLGVWAAAQAGVDVPAGYWTEVERAWNAAQEADGGWRYRPKREQPPVTAGVTAVGIGTMFMVQDQLHGSRGVDCAKSAELPAIEKGVDWITKHFDRVTPEQKMDREFPNINLYAIEQIGAAGGLKYFADKDWYAYGADFLLRRQRKDGSWGGGLSFFSDTSYGLMFLSRGRAPVIFNKLDYVADAKEASGAWNVRPRDVANLTRWIARTSERDYNWQIVNLNAPIADWHDAPILYMAGSEPIKVSKEHSAKIKQFLDEGGMILAHADCGKPAFASSIRNLASGLYPNIEFRELPENHPIYTSLYPRSKWKNKPSLLGLSNGVRELMILIPQADPGKTWQTGAVRGREDQWQLAADLVFYAADQRSMRVKGDTYFIADDPNAKTTAQLKVARLRYGGNWDPEPGAWRRMRNLLRTRDRLDVVVDTIELGGSSTVLTSSLAGYKLAHITGTTKFKLDVVARAQLKKFIAEGGTLLVDAAGGSTAFADAMEGEMEALGTGAKLDTLPPDHSLFGGKQAIRVAYRTFGQEQLEGKPKEPHLKAVRVGDRPAILFSREDLTAGMLGTSVGGIVGYTPATATEIVRRIALRAAGMDAPARAPAKVATGAAPGVQPKDKPAANAKAPAAAAPGKPAATGGDGLD